MKPTGTTQRILDRSLARREGRRYVEEGTVATTEVPAPQPDTLREEILAGNVTLEDVPISEKKHDVLSTATETSWREAGPTDLDALRCAQRNERFISPSEAIALEKSMGRPEEVDGFTELETRMRQAARSEYQGYIGHFLAQGMNREQAERAAIEQVRQNRALPLPGKRVGPTKDLAEGEPVPELMAEAASDSRVTLGMPVRREVSTAAADLSPATVVRDATPELLRSLDGQVRHAQDPE